jgi:hypothetical protein
VPTPLEPSSRTATTLRSIVLGLFFLGAVGTGAELLLLEHTEWFWQVAPLVALGGGIVTASWAAARPARGSLRAFQSLMGLCILLGGIGLYLHYRGNVEFELEMYPSLRGLELVWKALTGATPALAPGLMAQVGLLGLAYTYHHPALAAPVRPPEAPEGT